MWLVSNITEEGNAVLSFASEKLSYEDIFPIDIKFDETYSLIDVKVDKIANAATGDALSLKIVHSLMTESY